MTQRTLILALDFDGVMHPVDSRTEAKFCRLDLLEAWLRGRPSVRVLISSSWRALHPLDELVSYFSTDLQDRIAGVTPVCDRPFGKQRAYPAEDIAATRYPRQTEIERWIADSGDASIETWVALDDEPSLFAPACPNLVVCDASVGLTEEHLAMLDRLLFDGVWDGDPGIKARMARLEQTVRDGLHTPESLFIFTPEQVEAMTITSAPEPAPKYDWGEQDERLKAEDMVSVEQASELSGVPSAVLKRWAVSGRVLGLEHVQPDMRFPTWQFEQPLRDVISELFEALDRKDPWVVLRWFETPLDSLDGRTPRAAIERGDARRVVAVAKHE